MTKYIVTFPGIVKHFHFRFDLGLRHLNAEKPAWPVAVFLEARYSILFGWDKFAFVMSAVYIS